MVDPLSVSSVWRARGAVGSGAIGGARAARSWVAAPEYVRQRDLPAQMTAIGHVRGLPSSVAAFGGSSRSGGASA